MTEKFRFSCTNMSDRQKGMENQALDDVLFSRKVTFFKYWLNF